MKKRILASLLSVIMITTMIESVELKPTVVKAGATYNLKNPVVTDKASTWDCIWFGNYYQSSSLKKEPIKWRVLSVNGDDAFIWADKALDCGNYNVIHREVTWETCELRSWLNGYGANVNDPEKDFTNNNFIDTAFSSNEILAIKTTKVINDDNLKWEVEAGNDTMDKIYLLSISEATNRPYGFDTDPTADDAGRRTLPTAYSVEKGIYVSEQEGFEGWCSTWLRSPGRNQSEAAYISETGYIIRGGSWVNCVPKKSIRPVMHIDLSKTSLWSYAGTVCSDGTVKEVSAKTTTTTKPSSDTDNGNKTNVTNSGGGSSKGKILAKKLTLKVKKKKVKVGKSLRIKVTFSPQNVSSKKVKWSVSKKKWASISKKGKLKAKKAGNGKTVTVKCKALDGSKKIAKIRIKIVK